MPNDTPLLEREKSIGSGILEMIGEGAVFSLMDYAMLMEAISDHTTTDYLYKRAGGEKCRKAYYRTAGAEGYQV